MVLIWFTNSRKTWSIMFRGTPNIRARAHAVRGTFISEILSAISSGRYSEGDKLPTERELALSYAVGRQSVRKALFDLEKDGLINRRVGSGTFVAKKAKTDTYENAVPMVSPLDTIEARAVIEPGLASLVVARATDSDFAKMAQRLSEMENAPDQIAFKVAGYLFHLEIVRATRNPLLIAIYELLIAARGKAGWDTLMRLNEKQEQRDEQTAGARAIYDALKYRDAKRASELSHFFLTEMRRTISVP
jgi:GntR family transcriptional regulator, transcriptional repressor for pyruvate dehydrogenase complex